MGAALYHFHNNGWAAFASQGWPSVSLTSRLGVANVAQFQKVEKASSQAKACPKGLPSVSLTLTLGMEVFVPGQGVH